MNKKKPNWAFRNWGKGGSCHAIGVDYGLVELFTPGNELPDQYVNSIEAFKKNLEERYGFKGPVADAIGWRIELEGNEIYEGDHAIPSDGRARWLLAGGSCLNGLFVDKQPSAESDLDLWAVCRCRKEDFGESLKECFRRTRSILSAGCADVYSTERIIPHYSGVLSSYIDGFDRVIQFVGVVCGRSYQSVLDSFDCSPCAVGFDGERVFCTKAALDSLRNGICIYDETNTDPLYEEHLSVARRIKKMQDLGFAIDIKLDASRPNVKAWRPDFTSSEISVAISYPEPIELCHRDGPSIRTRSLAGRREINPHRQRISAFIITNAFRLAKWTRLLKCTKTRWFIGWYFAPDGAGSKIMKTRLEAMIQKGVESGGVVKDLAFKKQLLKSTAEAFEEMVTRDRETRLEKERASKKRKMDDEEKDKVKVDQSEPDSSRQRV